MTGVAPMILMNDEGDLIVLASTEAEALSTAQDYEPLDEVAVEPFGWMMDVGWDRERYERKKDFLAESGYTTWWEGFDVPHNSRQETKKMRRCWRRVFR